MKPVSWNLETKIFDPRDGSAGTSGEEVSDSSVVKRGDRWWMFLGGQSHGFGPTDIFSASLAADAPLVATGWELTRTVTGELQPVAPRIVSQPWDGPGGRHCPSYVRGFDPGRGQWIERIYYAGAAENLWGPYTIGYLEWDGEKWADQPAPAFTPTEEWERGSVFEPNLIYHDGKWKLWYVAGSHGEDYLVHGYSESADGRTNWSKHETFAPPEMKMFDFCVRPRGHHFEAVFSRVYVGSGWLSPETGLWHCWCATPSGKLSDWSNPMQIMTAEDRGWHSGPWKPSFQFDEQQPARALIFFNGLYRTNDPGPFPFAFTLGYLEIDLPTDSSAP